MAITSPYIHSSRAVNGDDVVHIADIVTIGKLDIDTGANTGADTAPFKNIFTVKDPANNRVREIVWRYVLAADRDDDFTGIKAQLSTVIP